MTLVKRLEERLKMVRTTADGAELITALGDPSSLVVEAAAKRIAEPRAAGALLRAYLRLHEGAPEADKGCWARMAILEALARLQAPEGEDAARLAIRSVQVEPVAGAMLDTAVALRVAGAGLYGNLRPTGGLIDLAWLLFDYKPNATCSAEETPFSKLATRTAAAKAIGQYGDSTGAAILGVKLAFPEGELADVLVECMDALAELKEPRLIELLAPYLLHRTAYLAAAAGTAIATVGAAAVPVLVSAIDGAAPEAQESLVFAVGAVRADAAQEALRELRLHPERRVRDAAKQLLD